MSEENIKNIKNIENKENTEETENKENNDNNQRLSPELYFVFYIVTFFFATMIVKSNYNNYFINELPDLAALILSIISLYFYLIIGTVSKNYDFAPLATILVMVSILLSFIYSIYEWCHFLATSLRFSNSQYDIKLVDYLVENNKIFEFLCSLFFISTIIFYILFLWLNKEKT
jgi:cation transport ATPase